MNIRETIKKLAGSFTKVSDSVKVTTDKLEHFQELVNKVVRGDFGNGEFCYHLLSGVRR